MTPQGIESLCTHAIASQGRFLKSYCVPLEKVHVIVRYRPEEDKGEKQCRVQYLPIEDASAAGQSELIQGSHALVYQQQDRRTPEDERAHGHRLCGSKVLKGASNTSHPHLDRKYFFGCPPVLVKSKQATCGVQIFT